jgi:DNA-binding MarR family transcriptional regulator
LNSAAHVKEMCQHHLKDLAFMQPSSNPQIDEIIPQPSPVHGLVTCGAGIETQDLRPGAPAPHASDPKNLLVSRIALNIQIRRLRRLHFGSDLISGPTWDMMLDLAMAEANGRELGASDLAAGAEVPLSSGLRLIAALERLGLVSRSVDTADRRRSVVRLTELGMERMTSFFETIARAWQDNQPTSI